MVKTEAKMQTATVIGLGFVGLTTALGLAEYGHRVHGIEMNPERLESISAGTVPFHEPGLDDALKHHLNRNFFPGCDISKAVSESRYVFFCVGTPCGENGQVDLTDMKNAVCQVLDSMENEKTGSMEGFPKVLVIKSTVPPSTTMNSIVPLVEKRKFAIPEECMVANNPEFLREGHCWNDFVEAERIVIGSEDDLTGNMLEELYRPSGIPVCRVSLNTAEFIKYLSNSSLANLISFANEMSMMADAFGGINIAEAFKVLHMDRRWQTGTIRNYCYPGCGYGGYCLPKDTKAFYAASKAAGFDAGMLHESIEVNEGMSEYIAGRIINAAGSDLSIKIGILGLSFNAGSDDVRGTASAGIIRCLMGKGYSNIIAYDPAAMENFRSTYGYDINYAGSIDELLSEAEVVAVLTRWDEFRNVRGRTDKPVVDCVYML